MKTTIHQFLVVSLLMCALQGKSQDIHFSQIFETPLLRNPALAGLFAGDVRIQSVYRSQWNSVTDAYKTGSLNGEFKLKVGQADDFLTIGGGRLRKEYDRETFGQKIGNLGGDRPCITGTTLNKYRACCMSQLTKYRPFTDFGFG